jgi:hypothetical protein
VKIADLKHLIMEKVSMTELFKKMQ